MFETCKYTRNKLIPLFTLIQMTCCLSLRNLGTKGYWWLCCCWKFAEVLAVAKEIKSINGKKKNLKQKTKNGFMPPKAIFWLANNEKK